jgi:outer membrane protein
MKKSLILLFIIGLFATGVNAQKFGHIYSQQILDSLPAYKTAQTKVQKFIDDETQILEEMQKVIEKEAMILEQAKDTMDAFIYEKKMRDLQMSYQRFQEKQQQSEQDLQIYQAREMEPIIKNLQKAIKIVGDREKFTYIFEASQTAAGIPVYTGGGTDATSLINKELHSYYK